MPEHIALLPAAGVGARMGVDLPKQYLDIAGRPMLWHALQAFERHAAISRIYVAIAPEDGYWDSYDWADIGKLHLLRCGGETRAATVLNTLLAMAPAVAPDDWILVHDAARPCLTVAMLDRLDTPVVLVAGGRHGGQPLWRWARCTVARCAHVCLFGSAGAVLADAVVGAGGVDKIVRCTDLDDALHLGVSAAAMALRYQGAAIPDLSLDRLYENWLPEMSTQFPAVPVHLSSEVHRALKQGQAVVALESTVITHGLPFPENLALARDMEAEVRAYGATPATVGVLEGRIYAGLEEAQLESMAGATELAIGLGNAFHKISSRDFGSAVALGWNGGTTVAATLVVAQRVGIKVFATGGIGGVHRTASGEQASIRQRPLVFIQVSNGAKRLAFIA